MPSAPRPSSISGLPRWGSPKAGPIPVALMLIAAAPLPVLADAAAPQPAAGQAAATAQRLGGPLSASELGSPTRGTSSLPPQQQADDCTADSPTERPGSGQPIERLEAAALLQRCLTLADLALDRLKATILATSPGSSLPEQHRDALADRVADLADRQFSTTTRLSGETTFVIGANRFGGSASQLVADSRSRFGASTFNTDLKLILNTSFSGRDLLVVRLRAGNFDATSNSFAGAGPSKLSELDVAFQESTGANRLAINRLYYQVPIGDFTATFGPRIEQDKTLAIWPTVYPTDSILDVMNSGGAVGALNLIIGTGVGLWWQSNGWAISASYIAANGQEGDSGDGGIATPQSGSAGSLQLGYSAPQWAVALSFSSLQNGFGVIPYGTNFLLTSLQSPGRTSAYGLGGYWQPLSSGWMPSISAGYGLNISRYRQEASSGPLASTSQSWSVGLQWADLFARGNVLGIGFGQPTYAIRLSNGAAADDGNWMWESWYQIRISDHISLTPAVFYLSRPLGADTPAGQSFQQLGVLIKTSFRF